jgi:hypothetical protein
MADYTPVFLPGDVIPLTTSTACAGGDLMIVTGSGTVGKAGVLASTAYVGVATQDQVANGRVGVIARDVVHESLADGTVTAGDQLTTTNTANRQVKTAPAVTTPTPGDVTTTRALIGVALTTAADNNRVRWMAY